MKVTLLHGDMRDRLAGLAAESIDAVVTDPPYHLTTGRKGGSGLTSANIESPDGRARGAGFMGMRWDGGDVAMRPETWAAILRVAKPGAHLIAFGGTRTYHRLACAIEDAGWELRDSVLNIHRGETVEIPVEDCPWLLAWVQGQGFPKSANQEGAWQGWGTALKPAFEPIVLARKPLAGNTAENLERYRVGALNIDGCRIDVVDRDVYAYNHSGDRGHAGSRSAEQDGATNMRPGGGSASDLGRWPANVVHDGSDEVVAAFPAEAGAAAPVYRRGSDKFRTAYGTFKGGIDERGSTFKGDSGSAARFFWCPKATRADRNEGLQGMPKRAVNWSSGDANPGSFQSEGTQREVENFHPTVKPTELMQYLCRLVAPRGATILDPFAGSGSTGKAAVLEGMNFIGVELNAEYIEIARRRIAARDPLFTDVEVA